MIELLILYELNKKILTMYGISKEIHADFSVLTTPSYGTIKPALNRLEKSNCIKTQKTMSSGGRPSTYYSITQDGIKELKNLLLSPLQENPIQYLPTARIRLSCAEVLEFEEQKELIKLLLVKTESIAIDVKNILETKKLDFYQKIVFDNLLCEYKNFISLLEGVARAGKN